MYDQSDFYTTIYDSYKAELCTLVQIIEIENASNNYSLSNEIKFNVNNKND